MPCHRDAILDWEISILLPTRVPYQISIQNNTTVKMFYNVGRGWNNRWTQRGRGTINNPF